MFVLGPWESSSGVATKSARPLELGNAVIHICFKGFAGWVRLRTELWGYPPPRRPSETFQGCNGCGSGRPRFTGTDSRTWHHHAEYTRQSQSDSSFDQDSKEGELWSLDTPKNVEVLARRQTSYSKLQTTCKHLPKRQVTCNEWGQRSETPKSWEPTPPKDQGPPQEALGFSADPVLLARLGPAPLTTFLVLASEIARSVSVTCNGHM